MKKITKRISQIALGASAALTLWTGKAMAITAQDGANAARADGMPVELVGVDGVFTNITNTILYVVGIVSVIMLIYGGLRYIISGGDSKKVTDAKNTILYAIIGLIIAILSFAIVNFVLNSIGINNPENQKTEQVQEQQSSDNN
ncbi:hypothetical protein IJ096_02240 [Candidatus Saccharibacteria bacterium]|nr:hypothetical protein [Candidatus Saccharibacteria bacterium]